MRRLWSPLSKTEAGLSPHRLPKRNPESIDVTNDELPHAIKSVVQPFDDFHSTVDPSKEIIDVVGRYVQVDLATVVRARFPTSVEHDLAVSERQRRPVHFAIFFVVSDYFESDQRIPIDRGPDIKDMNHRNDFLWHGSLSLTFTLRKRKVYSTSGDCISLSGLRKRCHASRWRRRDSTDPVVRRIAYLSS